MPFQSYEGITALIIGYLAGMYGLDSRDTAAFFKNTDVYTMINNKVLEVSKNGGLMSKEKLIDAVLISSDIKGLIHTLYPSTPNNEAVRLRVANIKSRAHEKQYELADAKSREAAANFENFLYPAVSLEEAGTGQVKGGKRRRRTQRKQQKHRKSRKSY